jgi:hypothetical protein
MTGVIVPILSSLGTMFQAVSTSMLQLCHHKIASSHRTACSMNPHSHLIMALSASPLQTPLFQMSRMKQ